MTTAFQGSLFDTSAPPGPGQLAGTIERVHLSMGAWIDLRPGWLAGADELFLHLRDTVPWKAERRQMYERLVDVPRLLAFYGEGRALPHPDLDRAKEMLDDYYRHELGEPFRTAGLCYYRDGRDSVAWHGDTTGRGATEDTMVAIVSVGDPRALTLRPRGGDSTSVLRYEQGHGDLIVMGGSCQRTWEHAILKTARPAGPRISIQFRPRGVS
jgi:alkylated DNA repair dioxygenase AlkB